MLTIGRHIGGNMTLNRCLSTIVLCAVALIASMGAGWSQAYPSRPIRIIVPITAGSITDVAARMIGQELSERLGVNVIIDNRPGAGSVVGSTECARSAPDGYTLCLLAADLSFGPFTIPNLTYNPDTDFRAVSNLYVVTQGLFAKNSLKANNMTELKAIAVAAPKSLSYAALGLPNDIFREWLNDKWKTDIVGVPYKGGSEVVSSLMAESTDIGMMGMGNATAQLADGKLKILSLASTRRSALLPNTATFAEDGLPDWPGTPIYWGILVPTKTPEAIVTRLNKEFVEIVRGPKFMDFAKKQYLEVEGSTPDEFEAYLKADRASAGALIKKYRPQLIPAGVTVPAAPGGASK